MSSSSKIFQALMMDNHPLPGIWSHLLPEDFSYLRLPKEAESNCSQCPQIEKQGFRKDYRCCTYFPRIPNFMLGLALISGDEARANLVRSQIKGGFVLPEGTQASPRKWTDSIIQNSEDGFGRGSQVLCPFLLKEQQMCGMHNYRGSVCSTFFCELEHGRSSEEFWDQLQSLMLQLETALAQYLMENQGYDVAKYFNVFDSWADKLDDCSNSEGGWSSTIYKELWGSFLGREEEFLVACAKIVLDHEEEIFEIASKQNILQTLKFEQASYAAVPSQHHQERDREPFVNGQVVPVKQLWYEFQARHKNLWVFPLGKSLSLPEDLEFEETPQDESVGSYYRKFPYRAVRLKRFYLYLDQPQYECLKSFRQGRTLDSDLLESMEKFTDEPREILAQWINRKVIDVSE